MKLITDLKKIAHLSERNRKANFAFRAKLKHLVEDEAALDAQVHAIYKEVVSEIDCRSCGNCCKAYEIVVSESDVTRLAKAAEMTAEAFSAKYLGQSELDSSSCLSPKPCPFLKDNTCTQYQSRPDVCREYPHLDKDNFLGRSWGVIDNTSTCPQAFNVWERLKREFRFDALDQ